MIEFLVGVILGVFVSVVITAQDARELEAENRALREVIRHAARTSPNVPLRRYLNRALGDEEAGA